LSLGYLSALEAMEQSKLDLTPWSIAESGNLGFTCYSFTWSSWAEWASLEAMEQHKLHLKPRSIAEDV
jgi:hypothetical protein